MIRSSCLKFTLLMASAVSLSGCGLASLPKGYTPVEKQALNDLDISNYVPRTADERAAVLTQDLFAQAAFWSREYELNPADLEAAVNLSSALRRLGNPGQSIEIATQTRALYPRDVNLMTELGASLIANNQPQKALKIVDDAIRMRPQQSRLWSMKGAAFDQLEMFDQARQHYSKALQLSPNDPKIMTNVGLSYALQGDPKTAEAWLRRAASSPRASANTRQNLALILNLQGKIEESEKWARMDSEKTSPEPHTPYSRNLRGAAPQVQSRGATRPYQTAQRQPTQRHKQVARSSSYRTAPTADQMPSAQQMPTTQFRPRSLSAYSPQLNGGPKTASDAARLAAQKMPATQQQPRIPNSAPNNVLEKIARSNRSKKDIAIQTNAYNAQIAQQRAAQYYAQQGQRPNITPQQLPQYGYTQFNPYAQAQAPAQSQTNIRVPARSRRR